jgi:hypothetical protein
MTRSGVHSPSAHTHQAEDGPAAPVVTPEMIEAAKSPAGGFTKAGLASLGVSWPPPKGWKETLLAGDVFAEFVPEPVTPAEEAWSRALCVASQDEPDRIVGCPELPLWRSYLSFARIAIEANSILRSSGYERQRMNQNTAAGEGKT